MKVAAGTTAADAATGMVVAATGMAGAGMGTTGAEMERRGCVGLLPFVFVFVPLGFC